MNRFQIKGKISRKLYVSLSLFTFALFVTVWCLLTYGGFVQPFFLSSPTGVVKAGAVLLTVQDFLVDVRVSVFRILLGFFVSALVAIPIGILIGCFMSV